MRAALMFLLAAGCTFTPGVARDGGGGGDGSSGDAGCTSFSSQLNTCLFTSTIDLTLSGTNTYDTDTGTLMMGATPLAVTHRQFTGGAGKVDAIVVLNFRMTAGASLRATGSLPFAIIAFGSVTLDGNAVIDLSDNGAGARMSCPTNAGPGMDNGGGAGGGGGGGFGAAGAVGGTGNSDGTHSTGGSAGPAAAPTPTGPLGGCPGGKGGKGSNNGGDGAAGGGAIYIAAASHIDLMIGAGINAGGGGGKGGTQTGLNNGDAGGGGGGSGGMIMLEARMIRSTGALAANGGGGGGGSGGRSAGGTGGVGILGAQAAGGGSTNGGTGTVGGVGGAKAMPTGSTTLTIDQGGGGGGGGGAGFVIVTSADAQLALVSP